MGDALMVDLQLAGATSPTTPSAARAPASRCSGPPAEAARPGWPRFRVGVNSGPATVVVLGVEGGRTYTVVGDTVNVASRLEGIAPSGGVALGPLTADRLAGARTRPLGHVTVKGRVEPVDALLLVGLPDGGAHPHSSAMRSATRSALAMMVSVGFTAELDTKKLGVDDVEVVEVVHPAVDVERRGGRVGAEAHGAVLVGDAGDPERDHRGSCWRS